MKLHATLAAAATALSAQTALAVPIPVYTGSFLTGVIGLETSLGAFNVEWELDTCANVYGTTACTLGTSTGFQFSKEDAFEVTKGLNTFMSTIDKTMLPGYTPATGNSLTNIGTPFAMQQTFAQIGPIKRPSGEAVQVYYTNGWGRDNDNGLLTNIFNVRTLPTPSRYTFATYTPYSAPTTAVPEPSSWALMALGLGALGMASRKRPSNLNLVRLT